MDLKDNAIEQRYLCTFDDLEKKVFAIEKKGICGDSPATPLTVYSCPGQPAVPSPFSSPPRPS